MTVVALRVRFNEQLRDVAQLVIADALRVCVVRVYELAQCAVSVIVQKVDCTHSELSSS
jgi:hypothetical protein